MSKYFERVRLDAMNGTQHILANESTYGTWMKVLGDQRLTLYQLAGEIHYVSKRNPEIRMPKSEQELGFALLRLMQEGLVKMSNTQQGPLVKFKKLHADAVLPKYQSEGAAGADVCSVEHATLLPGDRAMVALGFAVAIEPGWELQVRPRSGLAAKHGITVLNTPGTIDSDYRGECKVILFNGGRDEFKISPGDRIAQVVVKAAPQAHFFEQDELDDTERGAGGFGSTGV